MSLEEASAELFAAAKAGDVQRVLWCIAQEADVNWACAAERKKTAVHVSCEEGHVAVLECLLLNGASILVLDDKDLAPLDYAQREETSDDCVSVLISHSHDG